MSEAARVLQHYLHEAWEAAGLRWPEDADAEINFVVEDLRREAVVEAEARLAPRFRTIEERVLECERAARDGAQYAKRLLELQERIARMVRD